MLRIRTYRVYVHSLICYIILPFSAVNDEINLIGELIHEDVLGKRYPCFYNIVIVYLYTKQYETVHNFLGRIFFCVCNGSFSLSLSLFSLPLFASSFLPSLLLSLSLLIVPQLIVLAIDTGHCHRLYINVVD